MSYYDDLHNIRCTSTSPINLCSYPSPAIPEHANAKEKVDNSSELTPDNIDVSSDTNNDASSDSYDTSSESDTNDKYYNIIKRPCLGLPQIQPKDSIGFTEWMNQKPLSMVQADNHKSLQQQDLSRSISGGYTNESGSSGIRAALNDPELNKQFGITENPFTDTYQKPY
jgi:hypothetical protein